jgi:choice-of-anchor C domain-containing protein
VKVTSAGLAIVIALAAWLVLASTTLVGTASASVATPAASGNLIKNGGFEEPPCSSVCEYSTGSTAISHWTVGGNSVDIVNASYFQPAQGSQSLDLAGSTSGSLTQKVATTSGTLYLLKWEMAGNPVCGQPVKVMHVSWDGTVVGSFKFDTSGHSTASMGWVERHLTVKADGAKSTIKFADATPDHSACGATLDEVSLKA